MKIKKLATLVLLSGFLFSALPAYSETTNGATTNYSRNRDITFELMKQVQGLALEQQENAQQTFFIVRKLTEQQVQLSERQLHLIEEVMHRIR